MALGGNGRMSRVMRRNAATPAAGSSIHVPSSERMTRWLGTSQTAYVQNCWSPSRMSIRTL